MEVGAAVVDVLLTVPEEVAGGGAEACRSLLVGVLGFQATVRVRGCLVAVCGEAWDDMAYPGRR